MSTSGFCLVTLLITFIVLKLCHVVAWPWWWVMAPLWVPVVLGILALGLIVVFDIIKEFL